MRPRSLVTAVIVLVAIVAAILLTRGRGLVPGAPQLPLDLKNLLPADWEIVPGKFLQCNLNNDPANTQEWLLLYRYGKPTDKNVSHPGFIGGVVFATEANRVPQDPGETSPYRPVFLVPYKLLPDIYEGKGQGYLGETDATIELYPAPVSGQPCTAQEITIFGTGGGFGPTRLSIFRWDGSERRYQGVHYAADARLVSDWNPANPRPITHVLTYNRFNDRSTLCTVHGYSLPDRTGVPAAPLVASENPGDYTIDFCFSPPADPVYPEGVVVALLRGSNPPAGNSPTGASFLITGATAGAAQPVPDMALFGREQRGAPIRILMISNPGVLGPFPATGRPFPTPSAATGTDTWWQSAERADVQTTFVLNGQQRDATWHLVSIANERMTAASHWRVESVSLP